jgi:hypothetical protein
MYRLMDGASEVTRASENTPIESYPIETDPLLL